MKELQIFNSEEFGRIRSVVIDNEPWFVGNDVAKALGYSKVWDAIKTNVDEMDTSLMGSWIHWTGNSKLQLSTNQAYIPLFLEVNWKQLNSSSAG